MLEKIETDNIAIFLDKTKKLFRFNFFGILRNSAQFFRISNGTRKIHKSHKLREMLKSESRNIEHEKESITVHSAKDFTRQSPQTTVHLISHSISFLLHCTWLDCC